MRGEGGGGAVRTWGARHGWSARWTRSVERVAEVDVGSEGWVILAYAGEVEFTGLADEGAGFLDCLAHGDAAWEIGHVCAVSTISGGFVDHGVLLHDRRSRLISI